LEVVENRPQHLRAVAHREDDGRHAEGVSRFPHRSLYRRLPARRAGDEVRVVRKPVVLAYHGVGRTDEASDPAHLVTSPEHLESHVRLLQRRGYRFLTAEQALDAGNGGPPPDGAA